jgi:hypothetical protein
MAQEFVALFHYCGADSSFFFGSLGWGALLSLKQFAAQSANFHKGRVNLLSPGVRIPPHSLRAYHSLP